jgi:hypothetical protein
VADEVMLSEYGQNLESLEQKMDDMRNELLIQARDATEAQGK